MKESDDSPSADRPEGSLKDLVEPFKPFDRLRPSPSGRFVTSVDHSFWGGDKSACLKPSPRHRQAEGPATSALPEMIYPLDYGYLENTTAGDGDGIDVWIGTQDQKTLTGILCTFDTLKQDAEIKLLLGCDRDDLQSIQRFYGDEMKVLYIPAETQ